MATYYFDTNGTTAGFGTLTGNWNPSTALWSTSTAGTAATAAVTFTNADVARFGFAGTTGTAGTATITAAVTNTVNQVVTANLAGLQTIAGPGTLELAGTTPTINVGSAGGLTISAPITGTAGFTKAGSGTLNASATSTGLSGAVEMAASSGVLQATATGASFANLWPNVTSYAVGAGSILGYNNQGGTTGQTNATFTGLGAVSLNSNANISSYTRFTNPNALSGLTGTTLPTSGNVANGVLNYAYTGYPTSTTELKDFPSLFSLIRDNDAAAKTMSIKFIDDTAGVHTFPDARIAAVTLGTLGSGNFYLYANQAAGSTLVFGSASATSGLVKAGSAAAVQATFVLSGTNTESNTIAGPIVNGAAGGSVGIAKEQAGKWILSGANTYTGTTTVSAGTLSAQSAGAFGTSGAVTQTGGTIDVSGGVALTKTGAAFTLVSNAGANALTTTTGTNTLACAGITLSSTIIVDAAAGASLTVNNTAAMSGPFGITKNNSGEIGLGTFANTYTGAVTINAGTLTVGNLQNTSTASSLGTGALSSAIVLSGTLKYNGTGHSTNRSITFTGAAPALDASGSGAVTYSAATQAAGARTITFTGSSTADNTLSAALSDGTGEVSVAKSGAGKWVLSNATLNYTGTTTISDGTLNLGGVNRTLSGALSVSGGTVENSTNTISANTTMTGGTITAELTGNKTLDVNSGSPATLQPTNNGNTFSGATTVAAGGILRLVTGANPTTANAGRVLGTSAVSVSGDIKTSATGAQRGQMRYGGNLTFNTGAKLYVGGA